MDTLAMIDNAHVEQSPLRRVSMGAIVYVAGTGGNWHDYKPSRASRARLERLIANYGIQVHHTQYDFPEVLECKNENAV